MAELAEGDTKAKPLPPNILDSDDEFVLRSPQQPLPALPHASSHFLPHGSHILREDECEIHCRSNTHSSPIPNARRLLNQNDNEYRRNCNSPPFQFQVPASPTVNRMSQFERVGYNINNPKGRIEKELKNILREIRVITDKIKDEVIFNEGVNVGY